MTPNESLAEAVRFLHSRECRGKPSGHLPIRELVSGLLAECVRLCGAQHGSIWLADRAGESLKMLVGLHGEERKLHAYRLRVGEGITGACASIGHLIVVNDVAGDGRHSPHADRLLGFRTEQLLSCPLLESGRGLGVMNVLNRRRGIDRAFGEVEKLIAMLFAGTIARLLCKDSEHSGELAKAEPEPRKPRADKAEPIFASSVMEEISNKIRLGGERNLLLTGETGVGKDMLARHAHDSGSRARRPFASINCATLQESLWESEFFGHSRGAFTGATRDKPGLVETADGGTLFLNEVGEIPLNAQAKLLSFLDTGEFQRVGETRRRRVHSRIISATNQSLQDAIRKGQFRRDLYHRLAEIHIHIPPLRDRPADIVALAVARLDLLARQMGCPTPWLDDAAHAMLTMVTWEGNVRALFAAVDSAFTQARAVGHHSIMLQHFPQEIAPRNEPRTGSDRVESDDPIRELGRLLGRISQPGRLEFAPLQASTTHARARRGIFDRPQDLEKVLEQTRCVSSGRRNLSAAHRRLVESGEIEMSLQTFLRRLRTLSGSRG